MRRTKIEYLTHTWSPVAMRCAPVSPGCAHCWHLRMANRLAGIHCFPREQHRAYNGEGPPVLLERELSAPLRLRKPAVIGVQFMGDLFHEAVLRGDIFRVYLVMRAAPQHTFVVLTKRPKRLASLGWWESLPNVWLGVSVEGPDEMWRVEELLTIPAAVRWVSYEPALGAIDLSGPLDRCHLRAGPWRDTIVSEISLVVAGAETGPGKRPADPAWFRSVRDQCRTANVPFYYKVGSDGLHTLDGVVHEELPE